MPKQHAHVLTCYKRTDPDWVFSGSGTHGWKVNRASLMMLVCAETARMEAVRVQQLPYVFQRLPLNAHGNLPLSEVQLFVLHMLNESATAQVQAECRMST